MYVGLSALKVYHQLITEYNYDNNLAYAVLYNYDKYSKYVT